MCNPSKPFAALLVLLVLSSPSRAGGVDQTDTLDACRDAKTEPALADCVAEQRRDAENAVDTRLEQLLERHREDEPPLAALLERSQAHWRRFAEARCQVENYDARGGTAYDVYRDACMAARYRERAATLQRMIDHP